MTDLNSIFQNDSPPANLPAADSPKADKPKKKSSKKKVAGGSNGAGKRRGPRRTPVAVQTQAVPAADPPKSGKKRGRKPRPSKAGKASLKLDLTTMMGALVGLKSHDAELVGKIAQALQTINKKSRERVLAAVGRLFT